MPLAEAVKTHETTYSVDDAMDVLLSLLDEGIDDMEADRIEDIDTAWEEIDKI
ncbi:MAG: hypothetical protein K5673_08735 [Lachnospiraceae bacterium]|nr:hypothetical protein [Lachnospiraceae bacterium]